MHQVEVEILGQVITSQHGTLKSGDILRTDPAFAKHLVEDCAAARYVRAPEAPEAPEAPAAVPAAVEIEPEVIEPAPAIAEPHAAAAPLPDAPKKAKAKA